MRRYALLLLLCVLLALHAPPALAGEEEYIGFARVLKGDTNFREAPGGNIICRLSKDAAVYVIDRETDAGGTLWYKARALYNQRTPIGYIRADLLEVSSKLLSGIVDFSISYYHLLAVRADGGVIGVGNDHDNVLAIEDWSNVTAVAAGHSASIGLRVDGTVAFQGSRAFYAAPQWRDIQRIGAEYQSLYGIRGDGSPAICFESFHDVSATAAQMEAELGPVASYASGPQCIYGVKADGTVIVLGAAAPELREAAQSWRDIAAISVGFFHVAGLRKDGTVVAASMELDAMSDYGQCDTGSWTGIVAIDAFGNRTVGLKSDGTVVTTDSAIDVSGFHDIVRIESAIGLIAGLTSDGEILMRGDFAFWMVYGSEARVVKSR